MPEETSPAQPPPEEKSPEGKEAPLKKGKGGWFQKIPKEILFSPGGIILIFLALSMEIVDLLIPWPLVEEIIMLPLNILFCVGLISIAKVSVKSLVLPFLIERIPIISGILPSFLLRLFF